MREDTDLARLPGSRAEHGSASLSSQPDHVLRHRRELLVADLALGESRHRAQAVPHLEPDRPLRCGLVVERWPEPALTARMTLRAIAVEHLLAERDLRVRRTLVSDERLGTPRRAARDGGRHGERRAQHRQRVIRHSTPVPDRGRGLSPIVITPKSTTYSAVPARSNRTATGRSSPPVPSRDAGPFSLPRFTAKSSITPVRTSTRTTLNPTGESTLPTFGAMSPNCATNASPTWPNASLREKSRPFDDEWTPSTAVGRGGMPGRVASTTPGAGLPRGLYHSASVSARPAWKSGQPYHAPSSTRHSTSPVPNTGRLPRTSNEFSVV